MSQAKSPLSPPRRRLLLTIYLVGVAQLAVAGIAIVVVQRLLERAPRQFDPARQKALLDGFAEFYDQPAALQRALGKVEDTDLTFYRSDGTLVASTDPPLAPLASADGERLARAAMIFVPTRGPVPITAVPILRDGNRVGYGLVHLRPPSGMRLSPRDHDRPPPRDHDRPPPPDSIGQAPPEHAHHGPPPGHDHHGPPPPGPSLLDSPSKLPIVIACALLGAAVISFVFARSLARPLARLAAAAQAFGGGDLTARARISRSDELGAVARTFDEMADRVNALIKSQREFLANVSHELRTPLARIRVALDIAAEGDMESARQSLREIAEDWGDLDRLIEDVLAVARFDLAQDPRVPAVTLRYERLDARVVGERAATAFRAVHAGHPLEVDSSDEPIMLYGDGAMLRRVLDNLLENAARYSDPATTIRLDISRRDEEVEFSVADQGIGIDAADLPRLFEPFFRSDRSRARKTGGVGLGLALAKRIVTAHHGRIAVRSDVGRGTTVAFTVPIEPPAA